MTAEREVLERVLATLVYLDTGVVGEVQPFKNGVEEEAAIRVVLAVQPHESACGTWYMRGCSCANPSFSHTPEVKE